MPDLTPNIGLWWYFFIEIFDHFRDFFLLAFNVHAASYSLPLTIKYRYVRIGLQIDEMSTHPSKFISTQPRPSVRGDCSLWTDCSAKELSDTERRLAIPGSDFVAYRNHPM